MWKFLSLAVLLAVVLAQPIPDRVDPIPVASKFYAGYAIERDNVLGIS